MKLHKSLIPIVLVSLILIILTGCGKSQAPVNKSPIEVHISAAVSLKDALSEIQTNYQKQHPQIKLFYNFGASGSLQKQIEQGAPADIFISAAPKQMNELAAKGLIKQSTHKNLVENQLVAVVPVASKLTIMRYEDLAQAAVRTIAIGEPNVVPAGQYAAQALQSLGIWDTVKGKAVFAKDVRTVLAYTETGNVDAGIVYKTDAAASSKVKVAAIAPADSHQPIVYPVAILATAKQVQAAEDILAYLFSPESRAIFEKHGFVMSK